MKKPLSSTHLSNTPLPRRQFLRWFGTGLALSSPVILVACGDSNSSNSLIDNGTNNSCALIPTETEGPYPLLSILSNTAMLRQNILEDRTGIPLNVKLNLVNINNSCQPVTNAYIYIWHCDKDGEYSGYNQQLGKTFLRGIWSVDSTGSVTFQTIYPGWYTGRITHIHFQVYLTSVAGTATATSQIAFPQEVTSLIYSTALYAARGQNTSVTSFAQDNIFSDGTSYQMATMAGNITDGFTATLTVGIKA